MINETMKKIEEEIVASNKISGVDEHELLGLLENLKDPTVKPNLDLLEGNKPKSTTCYMGIGGVVFEYDEPKEQQATSLEVLGITYAQAMSYKKYCQYSNY